MRPLHPCAPMLCAVLLSCSRTGLGTTEQAPADATRSCPASCDDGDECTLDACDPGQLVCTHEPAPRDADADSFDACAGDCDDRDPSIHPGATELCDGIDQNCNGEKDDDLRSECGDCRPGCRLLYLPGAEPWQPTQENSSSVRVQGDDLVLSGDMRERFDAWIANDWDSKVTRLDTRDGAQIGRYDSVLRDGSNHAEPLDVLCDRDREAPEPGGNCPSRTAVDLQGNVYVANRAFERQGTVTKIAAFDEDCIDRDGDGEIQTSRDLNGDGRIDLHGGDEYLGQADECLLWTVDVGSAGGVPRALAVAPDGSVWVGLHGDQQVVQLDPGDGRVIATYAVPGFRPYGAVVDSRGRLWLTEALTGQLLSIDTKSGKVGKALLAPSPAQGCPSSYGVTVDTEDRVWIAGFTCQYAFRYDPGAGTWWSVRLPDSGVMRGIAADDDGHVFVSASHEWVTVNADSRFGYIETSEPVARLTMFDADTGKHVKVFGTAAKPLPGNGTIGVGLDAAGRAWLVNRESGSATRVDPATGEAAHFGVGTLPYTYSDFTGYSLRRVVAPSGYIRAVLDGCAMGPSEWERVWVDAQVPKNASVQLRLRAAATREALARAGWLGPFSGSPLDLLARDTRVPHERFLEIEARLVAGDRDHTPALHEIKVQLHCPI